MINLSQIKDDIISRNPELPETYAESVAIAAESIVQTLGEQYEETVQYSVASTRFASGNNTYYEFIPNMDTRTCTKTITIRPNYSDDNVEYVGDLVSSTIASICDHPRFEGEDIVTNNGVATITYAIKDGALVETSSHGMGLQEGFKAHAVGKVMRENYNNSYTDVFLTPESAAKPYYSILFICKMLNIILTRLTKGARTLETIKLHICISSLPFLVLTWIHSLQRCF